MDALEGIFLALWGQVEVQHGGVEPRMAHRSLHGPEIDPGFEQMRGIAVAQGRHADSAFHDASAWLGCAEGALDAAAMHGCGGGCPVLVIPSSGGNKPGGMAVCGPVVSSERSSIWREGDGAVLGPRAPMHVDHEALAVDVSNVEKEAFVQSESQARDGGKGHTVGHGGGHAEHATHCLHTEESWEPVCGWSSHEVEELPSAFQNVEGEEADAARAEAHGGWREVIDVWARQHGVLERGCGEEVGCCAIELRQQAHLADIRLLRAFTLATALKSGDHVLAQWGHEISPCMS